MSARISWAYNDQAKHYETREMGLLPIMVRSARCNLRDLPPGKLVERHEEAEEMGGYFIVNGNEKLIRYLIVPRRNHCIALKRGAFMKRGDGYTEYGVQIRCTRPDQTSLTNALHYLSNGALTLRFAWRKTEYLIPVMMLLKALGPYTDKDVFAGLVQNDLANTFLTDRIELLLRSFKNYSLFTQIQCQEYLGEKFRVVLGCPEDFTAQQVGEYLIRRIVLVHLPNNGDKFRMLLCVCSSSNVASDRPHAQIHDEKAVRPRRRGVRRRQPRFAAAPGDPHARLSPRLHH
jgi:DNA-directed RNA polymerase I subunit RPA2